MSIIRALLAVAGNDRAWVGEVAAVGAVTDGAGVDRTGELTGSQPPGRTASSQDLFTIHLPAATNSTILLVESSRPAGTSEPETAGFLVEKPDGGSSWRELMRVHPRRIPATVAIPVEGSTTVRIRFLGAYRRHSLRRMDSAQGRNAEPLRLVAATHSGLGSVLDALQSNGGATATLTTGESATLSFEAPSSGPSAQRTYFLETSGSYSSNAGQTAASTISPAGEPPILVFTGIEPNPAGEDPRFTFSLPQPGRVRIRLYDVRGRAVATVFDEQVASGRHAVPWNPEQSGGRRLDAGVYFARMEYGNWHSERKLVLMGR